MPLFEYRAKTLDGAHIKGSMEALDREALMLSLKNNSYFVIDVKEVRQGGALDINLARRIKSKDIALFCRQFAFCITAGINMLRTIEIVKAQTENKRLRNILNEVHEELQKGIALSEALKKYKEMPNLLTDMIAVGEASGTLDSIMERLAMYYEKENKLNQKIKQSLSYPIVICCFALLVVIVLVTKVLPVFVDNIIQAGSVELPLPTKIVLGLSYILTNYAFVILFIILLLIVLFRIFVNNEKGRHAMDSFKLKMPLFGKINKKIVTARFARTFGTLMASGVPLLQCLEICSQVVGNAVMKDILQKVKEDAKKGVTIGESLEVRGNFPLMLTQMIRIGEESGTLDEIMEKTAEFFDNEVEATTTQLTTLLEPLIIIVLAFIVGFIILSIIMPMFAMYNAIGGM